MFRKLKLIRTLLVIGAGIALAVTYYRKRDLIRGFFRELFAPAAEPDLRRRSSSSTRRLPRRSMIS